MRLFTCFVALLVSMISSTTGNTIPGKNASSISGPPHLGKILFVGVVGSRSHKNFYYGIIEALSAAGYEVTVLTPYPPMKQLKNVREIVLESNDISPHMVNRFTEGQLTPFIQITTLGVDMCINALGSDVYSEVLQEKFDIAFISVFFNGCFLGHIHSLNIPFVLVSPAELFGPFSASMIGNPNFPSFDYNPMFTFPKHKSFFQRFITTTTELLLIGVKKYVTHRADSEARRKGLLPPDIPYLPHIQNKASLMIGNSFRLAEHPRPYMPNVLLAGGIHLKPPQPLPKDLDEWVNSSGDAGFIFFSLGSAVRASDLPFEKIEVLLSVFKSLNQKVLWKFNKPDVGAELPANVRLTTWAPQQDLLGHPKMRVFITHGGLLSTQEATYHGVPVIGIPVFGDQEGNMNKAESEGWGIKISWEELTYARLKGAIDRLIDDPIARQKVTQLGKLMRDRPTHPADDVVWWTGYLIRTGGAHHLQSGAIPLTWYELYNVDVWTVMVLLVLISLWVDYKILKFMFRRCMGKPARHTSKKKKLQ